MEGVYTGEAGVWRIGHAAQRGRDSQRSVCRCGSNDDGVRIQIAVCIGVVRRQDDVNSDAFVRLRRVVDGDGCIGDVGDGDGDGGGVGHGAVVVGDGVIERIGGGKVSVWRIGDDTGHGVDR